MPCDFRLNVGHWRVPYVTNCKTKAVNVVAVVEAELIQSADLSPVQSRRMFFSMLGLVTIAPLIGLGFWLALAGDPGAHSPLLLSLVGPFALAGSIGHVSSTSFLYVDRGFTDLMRSNRRIFLIWPAVAIGICVLAYEVGPISYRAMWIAFFAWNLWHFQRQNYGVISFAAQSRRLGPLPTRLNTVLNLGAISGILAVLSRPELVNSRLIWDAALVPLAGSTGLLIWLLATSPRLVRDPLVLAFSVLGWAFFIPTLLSPDPIVSLASYGIAHGLQYLVFMTIISRGSAMKAAGPAVLAVLTGGLTFIFVRLSSAGAGMALYTGVVMGHFIVDAKVWKLREPMQRGLIKERFAFLFG